MHGCEVAYLTEGVERFDKSIEEAVEETTEKFAPKQKVKQKTKKKADVPTEALTDLGKIEENIPEEPVNSVQEPIIQFGSHQACIQAFRTACG